MDSTNWPSGIKPTANGKGFRLKIYQKGRCIHSETINCNIHRAADLKAAVARREYLLSRLRLGLSIVEGEELGSSELFREAAQGYLDSLDDPKYSVRREYHRSLNRYWLQPLGNRLCHEITERQIREILSSHDVGWKTKRNALTPLRGVLKYANINPNPAMAIRPKKGQKAPIDRYTPKERDKILSWLDNPAKAYFAIAFGCGLRTPSEIIALTWDRWDGETLLVDRGIVRGRLESSTKTHRARRVYVPQWVRPYINELPSRFKGEWMFPAKHGGHLSDAETINKRWKEAHEKMRVPYRHPYTCRHTRAAELLSSGTGRYAEFAEQLGHGVKMFLDIYSELIKEYSGADNSIFESVAPKSTDKTRTKS